LTALALAIAVKGGWDADHLAEELRRAGVPPRAEVHIACNPEWEPARCPPSLLVHSVPSASLCELWGVAIANSTAPWVAVLHADALPAPGWFAAMTREIEREGWRDGYWGPVEPKPGISGGRMVGYLTEYCQFHRPLEAGLREIPGSNLVLPRDRTGNAGEFSKTRLLQQGLSPKYVPDAITLYARRNKLSDYCVRRFHHGRAYASERTPRLSLARALPLSAALPFLRTARVVHHAWLHKDLRAASVRLLPAILLAETCWSAGELIGYVTRRPGEVSALD
jgi:hypothetical protein